MHRQSSRREWEHPHSPGESLLSALATGGIGERVTLGEGQLDLRCLLFPGVGVGDLALFVWAVDIAWRKEQRNVGLGSASSSSGSAQLQLGDCFYFFITITSVRVNSMRLQPTAPRGQQAANPRASHGTKIPVVKRNPSSILRGKFASVSGG